MKTRLFTVLLTICCLPGMAQEPDPAKRAASFNVEGRTAIKGYDPVSYFLENKAVKGDPKYAIDYGGITYYFKSTGNMQAFKKSPAAYEPAYGGWCAYAMGADGSKVEVDPETFKIVNGKLYLFYNFYFTNTLKKWNEKEVQLKQAADRNWLNVAK